MSRWNSMLTGIAGFSGSRGHRLAWPALLVVVTLVRPVSADDGATTRIREEIHVDAVGDARVSVEVRMPAGLYTEIKQDTPNVAAMMRRLGWGQGWEVMEDAGGEFDDLESRVVFEYVVRGMARLDGSDDWFVPIAEGVSLELIAQYDSVAILNGTANTDLGLTSHVVHCVLPEDSGEIRLRSNPNRLAYSLPPVPADGDRLEAEFELFAREQMMSCLAKCYASSQFNLLWVARSVFQNTGESPIVDYRVRYRILGYSEWSGWSSTETVLPGQTVVEPYFPLLDLEKLAGLNSAVTTAVEVEYEYKTPGGETIHETDQRRLRILSRNQVFFSNLDLDDQVGWFDQFNYGPLLLASFVTGNDPVIQQVAGIISGRLGGVNASGSDEDAYRFLQDLFNFLGENGVSYQTPPGGTFEGQLGQHIKYGRDVLRNRAGTCVDLAILYGSVCQAVGLDPFMILVPGHCFPGVRMPNGDFFAVEATCIGARSFEDAVSIASQAWNDYMQSGVGYLIDVQSWHDTGVDALDLPPVAGDFLTTLGYRSTATTSASQSAVTATTVSASPGDVAAGTAYAVLRILNALNGTINYQIRIGDGEWQSHSVGANGMELHGGEIPPRDASHLPSVHIRFDYDLTETEQYWEYELEWSVLEVLNDQTIQTAYGYQFAVNEKQLLDLYTVAN